MELDPVTAWRLSAEPINIGGRWFVYDEEGHQMIETDSDGRILEHALPERQEDA